MSRLRRHWPWLVALLCAAITTSIAVSAYRALGGEPGYQLQITVEGQHDWNITQDTVDAAQHEPIRSWRPLQLTVTDRRLSGDELLRGEVQGTDILLSTALENSDSADYTVRERFAGTGFRRSLVGSDEEYTDKRFDIHNGFTDNLGLGHGPAAIVAAGEQAAAKLGGGPVTNPAYWLAGIGLGAMATAAFLTLALRRRRLQVARQRRLRAAGRKLARVVLDLEALEVTYRAAPESRRPDGFTNAWRRLESLSLAAARREQRLEKADPDRVRSAEFSGELSEFERDCRELTALADALLGAGSVHARLAGTGSTFDRLSQPINAAVLELLERLRDAPGRMVSSEQLKALRNDLDALINVANEAGDSPTAIGQWAQAERRLAGTVRKLDSWLRRYPHTRLPAAAVPEDGELARLRESLGLKEDRRNSALVQLGYANARVRAILGDLPGDAAPAKPGWVRALAGWRARSGREEPPARRRWLRAGTGAVILIGAMIVAGVLTSPYTQRPQAGAAAGNQQLELVIDGVHEQVDEGQIRRHLDVQFPQPERITIAVRDANAYLEYDPQDPDSLIPRNIPEILWRMKGEFTALVDPVTGELRTGEAIIPAMIFDNGELAIPGMASWQLARGDYGWGEPVRWEHGSIRSSDYGDITLANMIDDYAQALVRNDARRPDFSVPALFWTLSATLALTAVNVLVLLRYLLSATESLGRLGRRGKRLRAAQRELQRMALGLDDSRLNAVAVLGAGPPGTAAEAGQRLHERALAMAWREAQELAATPLAERYGPGYEHRINHLEKLVRTLGRHDVDAAARASQLIAATRGAGGSRPEPHLLPG